MKLRAHLLPGTNLNLATFCCGLGDLFSLPQAEYEKVLDAYVEAGGNFFDTAHAYSFWLPGGNGLSEIAIGDYVRRRGLEDVIIASKGGHPAAWHYRTIHNDEYLAPGRIQADIDDSLARLECKTIALYYLHRDDPRVPVSEIIDFLNGEIGRGRIGHLGASNWSVQRLEEANAYARTKNLQPFVISSPRWSLAPRKEPPQSTDAGSAPMIAWHTQNHFAMAPYTPAAHGFFAVAAESTEKEYGTPENHARRERVQELAKKHGATPAQIALAWLINHPFPVFPIVGNKSVARLTEALQADEIRLTVEELAWLDLKS
jgi:aryl-alcohol dehydrogenase-like predicted oxidoreductase